MSLISPPGSQPGGPRVEVRPPGISGTFGDLALEIGEAAGLRADIWQADAINLALSYLPDRRWACFEYAEWVPRQNGKGCVLELRALAGLFALDERLLMWSAHLYATAQEAFLRMDRLIRNLAEAGFGPARAVKTTYTNGEQGFERTDTGARLKFHARSKGGGRGWSGDCVIVDEAFGFTPEQQAAMMPTMSARPNPQILYTSTPPLLGDESKVMYALRSRAERGGETRLGYRDWGAAGDLDHLERVDTSDRALWRAANPSLGGRIPEDFVEAELRSMGPQDFARERLGIWPARIDGGGAIDIAKWQSLLDSGSKRHGDVGLGIDISPKRDYATVFLFGHREADDRGHAQIVDYRAGTDWIVPRMAELQKALAPIAWGMGAGTYRSLREDLMKVGITVPEDTDRPKRGDICVVSGPDMAAACGQIIDAVRQGTFRHVGQPPLEAAVSGAKIRQVGDVIAWARRESDADISPIVAMTVARWALLTRRDLAKSTYSALANFW